MTRLVFATAPAKSKAKAAPTAQTYGGLTQAYDYFNKALYDGKLPPCLITLQRHKGAYGYFAPQRFGTRNGKTTTDEIALNPTHFAERDERDILSTLAHEMSHLWQARFGTPSRGGYHNKEWGADMKRIGLHPSSTGAEGGKETGQKVSHYIIKGGKYDVAYAALKAKGIGELYVDRWDDTEAAKKAKKKKAASKTCFVCPDCDQKAWAKETANLMCGECEVTMQAAD